MRLDRRSDSASGSVSRRRPARACALEGLHVRTLSAWRFRTTLMVAFALTALLLAVLGISGVMSDSVARRTGELGVRLALGARPREVRSLVVGEGMRLIVGGGGGLGLAGAPFAAAWSARPLDAGRPPLSRPARSDRREADREGLGTMRHDAVRYPRILVTNLDAPRLGDPKQRQSFGAQIRDGRVLVGAQPPGRPILGDTGRPGLEEVVERGGELLRVNSRYVTPLQYM
jgi:hypothetical protein